MHNLCFSFLRGIKAVPREPEISAYAKLWRASKVHYGECGSGVYSKLSHYNPGQSCILGEQCCCVFERTPHPQLFVGRKVELGDGVFFTQSCCFVVWSSARKRKKKRPQVVLSEIVAIATLKDAYVVVQFYPWFNFHFLLFQTHYHTIPYPKPKANKN